MMRMVDQAGATRAFLPRAHLQAVILLMLLAPLTPAHAANYRIDPKETVSSFEVWLIGFVPIRGHFKRTTGSMSFDPGAQLGNIDVSIDTTSVVADSARAQAAARSAEFFDVEKYPRIEFKSSRFVFDGNRLRSIEGMLTLTGSTQPVTLLVSQATCSAADEREPAHCHANAVLTVKRSTFGMKAWSHSLGDEVTIRIAIFASSSEGVDIKTVKPDTAAADPPADAAERPKTP